VDDFRADYILAEACEHDVAQHCPGIKPGDGAVHVCLRKNADRLSEACLTEEDKLQVVQVCKGRRRSSSSSSRGSSMASCGGRRASLVGSGQGTHAGR
jgi:hypothetical protein